MRDSQPWASTTWDGQGDPPTASERRHEAEGRLRDYLRHGRDIRFVSVQFMTVVLAVVIGSLGLVGRSGTPLGGAFIVQLLLVVASVVVGIVGWLRARRHRRLQPQLPQGRAGSPLAPLTSDERRQLQRQLRGREPVDADSRDLVVLGIAWAQATTRTAIWPLISMGLWYAANALWLGWWWFIVLAALVALLFVGTSIERRRWKRVLRSIDANESSTRGDEAGGIATEA